MKLSTMTLPTAAAVAALAFAAAAATPSLAQTKQMKEQTVTVGGAPMYPSKNIVQNAVNSKDHTTLVAAVKAAGLVDTLQGAGPFTVFAPTNKAFDKLPKGTVDTLLKPENKPKLVSVLTYHVVPGRLSAKDLMDAAKEERRPGQVQDRRGRRAHRREQGQHAHDLGHQGQHVQGHDPERVPVERRHPRDRHRAASELIALPRVIGAAPSPASASIARRARRGNAAGFPCRPNGEWGVARTQRIVSSE